MPKACNSRMDSFFEAMAEHNRLGEWGEELVCQHLIKEGHAIVERNWRMDHLELDIVAEKDEWIAFVEVKTRRVEGERLSDVITPRKISRIVRAANGYLTSHRIELKPRFDVAFIFGTPSSYKLEYIPDAFLPKLRTYR